MANVVFQKRKKSDNSGYLFVRHIKDGKRIMLSLERRMTTIDFDTYFDKTHQLFKPSSTIDFKHLNRLISEKNNADPFGVKPMTLLSFWQSQFELMPNMSTRGDYNQNLVKMTKYLTSIEQIGTELVDVDVLFLKRYKMYLVEVGNNHNTIGHHFTILRSVLNMASSYPSNKYRLDSSIFKGLIKATIPGKKDLPTLSDIKILMSVSPQSLCYTEINMFLLGISLGGLRFGDLLFIRYGDFKQSHLMLTCSKTKKTLSIPYNTQIMVILSRIMGIPCTITKLSMSDYISDMSRGIKRPSNSYDVGKQALEIRSNVLKLIKSKGKSEFLFASKIQKPIFDTYDKNLQMTYEQHSVYGTMRTRYNESLSKICEIHQLSITKMSSHFSRYVAVMILIENGMDIIKISKVLQHAKIQQTIDYIKNNYDEAYLKEMSDMIGNSF